MRNLRALDKYRDTSDFVRSHYNGDVGDETCGVFRLPSPIDGAELMIVASQGSGWDHVSVSRRNRAPNWPEMAFIKKCFFRDGETAMQLHVPQEDHVNLHPNCLHLWRPQNEPIPRPPAWMVGPKEKQDVEPEP
jgi:hypothetical protein